MINLYANIVKRLESRKTTYLRFLHSDFFNLSQYDIFRCVTQHYEFFQFNSSLNTLIGLPSP